MAKTNYVVTAPYVTLTVPTTDGPQVRGFYAGAPVPAGVSDESLKHHLDNDLIATVEDAEAAAAEPAEEEPPLGGEGTLGNVEQPKGNASLEEWTAYATASGATADELEGLTRDQIRDQYAK